jgi:penicillin-binding protein 1A
VDAGWARLTVLQGMKIKSRVKQLWGAFFARTSGEGGSDEPQWLRRHWRAFALANVVALAIVVGDTWLYTCGFDGCPSGAEIRAYQPPEGSRVLDRSGRLIGRLEDVRRIDVPLTRIPRFVREAFVATEDRRFYHHNGLDWHAFLRATVRDAAALGAREGFSTITMQVARNSFASVGAGRTLRRKLLELRMARLLERNLTKDQILALYLNVIYLGNGTYGVEATSRDLFGTSVSRLTLAEGALLAALPKGPSVYTPRHDPDRARTRRDLVLSLMVREGYVSAARAAAAAREPIEVAETEWRPEETGSWVVGAARAVLDSVLGSDAEAHGDVTIYTTIDARAQRAAERAVRNQAASIADQVGEDGSDHVEGALVALDPRTGDIRALVGGRRYQNGAFDRALAAHRQPGSAFKPFVYAAALGAGYTPATLVDDAPVEVEQDGRDWTPANFGDEYEGRITMRRAIEHSSNAAAVRFGHAVGEAHIVSLARATGITSRLAPVPSIALGALEVTPLELVTAYAPFANGGNRVQPRLVRRIEGPGGKVLWSNDATAPVPALDPRDAFQLTSMLESVVNDGTGREVRSLGARGPIAGKTGTTNNGADVWFIGYTPSLVAGVWFGYDTPRSLGDGATGGRLAAPAWAEFYERGWPQGARDAPWRPPSGLVSRLIDADNGDLATAWCPHTQLEWFRLGTEPTMYCPDHGGPSLGARIIGAIREIFHY